MSIETIVIIILLIVLFGVTLALDRAIHEAPMPQAIAPDFLPHRYESYSQAGREVLG